jgi:chromate transporter
MNSPLPDVGASDQATDIGPGSLSEVVTIFFKLGLSSFGGPIAHLDYYHREFVRQRGWLDEGHYRQLLALCQFLPGPASTQMCYSIGALRAGTLGGLGAFLAFSVPSGLLLYLFALYSESLNSPWGLTVVHGLKLVTVVVVAQGVWSMARSLTPDMPRIAMAALATGLALRYNNSWMQLAIIGLGAMLGMVICRKIEAHKGEAFPLKYGRRTGAAVLAVFALLLVLALFWTPHLPLMGQVAGSFYRSGALVFGGGHVVLPLLRQTVVDPGWVNDNTFLAGYGAAQAVPGPLFAVAAFLGARVHQGQGRHAAILAHAWTAPQRGQNAGWRECRGGRHPGCGTLQSVMDHRGARCDGRGYRHRRVRSADLRPLAIAHDRRLVRRHRLGARYVMSAIRCS